MHKLTAIQSTHSHQTLALASRELRQTWTVVVFCSSARPERHSCPLYPCPSFSSLSLFVAVLDHNQHPSAATQAGQQSNLLQCFESTGWPVKLTV